ncbi:Wzz/FepE/Etk N-terminal domain-containing protein [sulfur-oxidizing endosymbiont of Gigantopelta aegis]|uniref:Wzz/FepE/Etk N-terminal domain-containing protein n=1 Tax=sulfur-oxidizing endosymbiont of Gigantopelta aegis TaxID=2794934 RepID=UPI0018DE52F5|nr:Wzz/FepE/Etk N-terminal domain-containing protein [sulfur-oxidizing endosymbiont of Gigantopelta aegis]
MNNSPALSNQQFEEETIDLREYWSVIRRHQWGIVGLAFAITLLAIVVVFSLDSVYQARATILLESQQAKVVSIEQVYGLNNKNMDYYYSQLEILKSRSIAEKVVKNCNSRPTLNLTHANKKNL